VADEPRVPSSLSELEFPVQLLVFEVNDPTIIEELHQRVFSTAVKMHKKLSFAFDMQPERKRRK